MIIYVVRKNMTEHVAKYKPTGVQVNTLKTTYLATALLRGEQGASFTCEQGIDRLKLSSP